MKRMWSKNELKNISQNEAKAVQKDISTLVDKDGHPRFIEGDIELDSNQTDITLLYGKWSLSGSHLLIVVCYSGDTDDVIKAGKLATINVPEWVLNKITPLFTQQVEVKGTNAYANDYSTQAVTHVLAKETTLFIRIASAVTLTKERACRINYDLLIDND